MHRDTYGHDSSGHEPNRHDPLWDGAPLDPFLEDGFDPATALDAEPVPEPLDEEEKLLIREDLVQLDAFLELLAPRGIKGIAIDCDGCHEVHYYAWAIMRANLVHMLQYNQSRVHEPPFSPDPDEFVSWDYARGYADAITDQQP